jgi:hypothetical protein
VGRLNIIRTRRNPLTGFVFAPASPLFVLALIALVYTRQPPEMVWGAILILPVSYATSFILGAPTVYLLRKWQKNRAWHYAIAGLLVASAPVFVTIIYPFVLSHDPSSPSSGWLPVHSRIAALMAVSGALVATVFWLVTRPDLPRDH